MQGLVIRLSEDLRSRTGMSLDPIEAQLVLGRWEPPRAGVAVAFANGAVRSWMSVRADANGWFELDALEGGYAYFSVISPRRRIVLLEGMGHDMVFVNGEPRAGNQYQSREEWEAWEPRFNFSLIPIELRQGRNDLLFRCFRGRLKVRLRDARSEVLLNAADLTLPDLIVGEPAEAWGALVVVNASKVPLEGASITAELRSGDPTAPAPVIIPTETSAGDADAARPPGAAEPAWSVAPVPAIPPLSIRKVGFRIESPPRSEAGDLRLVIRLTGSAGPEGGDENGSRTGAVKVPEGNAGASGRRAGEDDREGGAPERSVRSGAGRAGSRRTSDHASIRPIGPPLDEVEVPMRVVAPGEPYKRTFISGIDGAVQYYAVNPAKGAAAGRPLALFLTLHGAAVEALNQAKAYGPKTWGHIVAPTNRRPYGYNWEDWGQLDALEVLALARKELNIDPDRIYLTGHSMGGHGTWHIGETFPDAFAAIGPSAGWLSFYSYRARKGPDAGTPVGAILARAASPSDTFGLAANMAGVGVYVLHGSDDDNVPVTESRRMVETLGAFHKDFVYHEQKGAGHWWDLSDEPGADCVDWPPMFDFFARHSRPGAERVRQVDFITASPGVSSRSDWLSIEAQRAPMAISSASVRYDPGRRLFTGTTTNIARMSLDLAPLAPDGPVVVELDGQRIADIALPRPVTGARDPIAHSRQQEASRDEAVEARVFLERTDGKWAVTGEPSPALKGPHRYGPFKDAFRNRVLFVYGTKGTTEENAWAFAKARYDAERFWYQGNGSIEIVRDVEFDPIVEPDRNVVLYGNARTNGAWGALLGSSPVQVEGGLVRIGARRVAGADLACLFIRPRPGSATASVGAVAGTGIAGMRLTNNKLYLEAGYPFPDFLIFRAARSASGDGILAAGFFALDWTLGTDFALDF